MVVTLRFAHPTFLRPIHIIASEAKQSILSLCGDMDCFVGAVSILRAVRDGRD
jgi:hypothetical protein